MTLDELMDKLEDVKIKIRDREQAYQWLFEYGCHITENYGLDPQKHINFVRYCGVHKLAHVYHQGMLAAHDGNWEGTQIDFKMYPKGVKSIPHIVKREYKNGMMPTRKEYFKIIHGKDNLGSIEGIE